MKKLLFLVFLTSKLSLFAQDTEGVISYDEKRDLHRNLPDPSMKSFVPQFQTQRTELYFRGDSTLYKPSEEVEEEQISGGGGMQMRMRRMKFESYRNFATGMRADWREFGQKMLIVEDTIQERNWKLTGKIKKVAGYDCLEATTSFLGMDSTEQRVVAWFTESLALPMGPLYFTGLPGAVLEVDINEGEQTIVATKVDLKKLKADAIRAPQKGERMNAAQFEERMREMRKRMGGGQGRGGMMIMRN